MRINRSANRRVWAALPGVAPDGICLDENNQVWVANAIGPEVVLVAEGGDIVERLATSQPCYACMLGGRDGKTLFALTAAGSDGQHACRRKNGQDRDRAGAGRQGGMALDVLAAGHRQFDWRINHARH